MAVVSNKQALVINAVGFQLCWFACVLGGSAIALPTVALFLIWHRTLARTHEWRLIAGITLAGTALDSIWLNTGVLAFSEYDLPVIPLWLALLWAAFAATLLHSLQWLSRRPLLLAAGSAISAPVSYFAGDRVGVLSTDTTGLLLISGAWAILMFTVATIWKQSKC